MTNYLGVSVYICSRRTAMTCQYCSRPAQSRCGEKDCEIPVCPQCAARHAPGRGRVACFGHRVKA